MSPCRMQWKLRLMIEIGNVMSTSSQDRTRNVARTTSLDIMKYIMRTAFQIRKGDIRRTMSPDRGKML